MSAPGGSRGVRGMRLCVFSELLGSFARFHFFREQCAPGLMRDQAVEGEVELAVAAGLDAADESQHGFFVVGLFNDSQNHFGQAVQQECRP